MRSATNRIDLVTFSGETAHTTPVVAASPPPKPASPAPSELALLAVQVRAGNEEAARLLMQQLHPQVRLIVRRYRARQAAEEDLVQMVFMKMFTHLHQYQGQVPLEHWVSRIAVNTCLNQLQAEKIRPEWSWADFSEGEVEVLQNLASREADLPTEQSQAARELVEKLLQHLSAEDRLLMTLLHLEGRTVAEIRELTGWNTAVIKVRAFRARHKLRGHLRRLQQEFHA